MVAATMHVIASAGRYLSVGSAEHFNMKRRMRDLYQHTNMNSLVSFKPRSGRPTYNSHSGTPTLCSAIALVLTQKLGLPKKDGQGRPGAVAFSVTTEYTLWLEHTRPHAAKK